MDIVIENGNVFETSVQAVALPVNLGLDLNAGVFGYATHLCGELEPERRAGLSLGDAVWIDPGESRLQGLLGLIVREGPGEPVLPDAIRDSVAAAISLAQRRRLDSLAFVGVGAGKTGLPLGEVARAMAAGLEEHGTALPEYIVLADTNPDMVHAWREAVRPEQS